MHVHKIAILDGCGQSGVLNLRNHSGPANGRPFVFAGLKTCKLGDLLSLNSSQVWAYNMPEAAERRLCAVSTELNRVCEMLGGKAVMLHSSQLEAVQSQKHMYGAIWKSKDSHGSIDSALTTIQLHDYSANLTVSQVTTATSPVEVFSVMLTLNVSNLFYIVSEKQSSPSLMLYLLQACSAKFTTVWMVLNTVQAGFTFQSAYGLAKTINAENSSHTFSVGCIDAGHCASILWQMIPTLSTVRESEKYIRISNCGDISVIRVQKASITTYGLTVHGHLNIETPFLLTGGTGSLGLITSSWLVSQGIVCLHLLSRSATPSEGSRNLWDHQSNAACCTSLMTSDIAQESTVSLITGILKGRIGAAHTAGNLADAVLQNQSQTGLRHVWSAKAQSAWYLHTSDTPTICPLILFSSVAALIGSKGQANYAAANASLDGLAMCRTLNGSPTLSVQWGAWAGAGMASNNNLAAQLESNGVQFIDNTQGTNALATLVNAGLIVAAVAPIRWPLFMSMQGADLVLLENFRVESRDHDCTPTKLYPQLADAQLGSSIESIVLETVYSVTGMAISPEGPLLGNGGIDSLAATELQIWLQNSLGTKLPSTLVFDYPTARSLTEYIHKALLPQPSNTALRHSIAASQSSSSIAKYVLIEASTTYAPGGCDSTRNFLSVLSSGIDQLRAIPVERIDVSRLCGAFELSVQEAHFINNAAQFDNNFFHISPTEVISPLTL